MKTVIKLLETATSNFYLKRIGMDIYIVTNNGFYRGIERLPGKKISAIELLKQYLEYCDKYCVKGLMLFENQGRWHLELSRVAFVKEAINQWALENLEL